jgi:hypothetical protein
MKRIRTIPISLDELKDKEIRRYQELYNDEDLDTSDLDAERELDFEEYRSREYEKSLEETLDEAIDPHNEDDYL